MELNINRMELNIMRTLGEIFTRSPDGAPRRGVKRIMAWDLPMRPRSIISGNRTPYTGEQLREIRKRKGVGRPPETWGSRSLSRSLQAWQANRMAAKLPPFMTQARRDLVAKWWPMPIHKANLAEWNSKQRRGESAEDYHARRFGEGAMA